ncbi:MAG: hydroxyacid dehydrogenase [Candidatus Lokiarchaeota archaeon]|nr:hydroxyacid dehydrogenase [Candidatus Lokiarchaeota archaeon]
MKILITDKIQKEAFKIFDDYGLEYREYYDLTPNELYKEIQDYEAVIIRSRTKLTADILENGRKLKVIGRAGVGLDNIDLQRAEELGIKIFNTPEAPSVSVAELTIGLILNLARHISKADETMHCGDWCKSDYMGYILKDKKIGLIGFGNIGQEVAKRCSAFEMKIGVYDTEPKIIELAKELGYTVYLKVDDLIKDVQIISLHLPSTNETKNTINEKRLNMMNKNSVIINTARGDLIDEVALVKALKNKQIGGAALDVYKQEPLANLDLCSCEDNLILTPHIGSQTVETQIQASFMIAEKIAEYLMSLISN